MMQSDKDQTHQITYCSAGALPATAHVPTAAAHVPAGASSTECLFI